MRTLLMSFLAAGALLSGASLFAQTTANQSTPDAKSKTSKNAKGSKSMTDNAKATASDAKATVGSGKATASDIKATPVNPKTAIDAKNTANNGKTTASDAKATINSAKSSGASNASSSAKPATQVVNKSADKAVGTDSRGRTIYEGPKGGRYTLSPGGNKEYIKKD